MAGDGKLLISLETADRVGDGVGVVRVGVSGEEAEVRESVSDAGFGVDGIEVAELEGVRDLVFALTEDEETLAGFGGQVFGEEAFAVGGFGTGDCVEVEGVGLIFAGFAVVEELESEFGGGAAADEFMGFVGGSGEFFKLFGGEGDEVAGHDDGGGFAELAEGGVGGIFPDGFPMVAMVFGNAEEAVAGLDGVFGRLLISHRYPAIASRRRRGLVGVWE